MGGGAIVGIPLSGGLWEGSWVSLVQLRSVSISHEVKEKWESQRRPRLVGLYRCFSRLDFVYFGLDSVPLLC